MRRNYCLVLLSLLIILLFITIKAIANPAYSHCQLMEFAEQGYLQTNGKYSILTLSKTDHLTTSFQNGANSNVHATNYIETAKIIKCLQQSTNNSTHSSPILNITALNAANQIVHFNYKIKNVRYNQQNRQLIYQLTELNPTPSEQISSKIQLSHVLLLISGDGVCINCGEPW